MVNEIFKDYNKKAESISARAGERVLRVSSIPTSMLDELGISVKQEMLNNEQLPKLVEEKYRSRVSETLKKGLFEKAVVGIMEERYGIEETDEKRPLNKEEFTKLVKKDSLNNQEEFTNSERQAIRKVIEDKKGYKKPINELMKNVLEKVEDFNKSNNQVSSEQDHSLRQF